MTSSPSLNRYTPHRWARVVSGEAWAEYGLGPSGQIEAKTTRGPLIVWATKPGKAKRPHLDYVREVVAALPDVPTPSPLEVEAARMNRKAHFLAFVRAARGKVRPSVRWKTKHRKQRTLRITQLLVTAFGHLKAVDFQPSDDELRLDRIMSRCNAAILERLSIYFGTYHLGCYEADRIIFDIIKQLKSGEKNIYFPAIASFDGSRQREAYKLSFYELQLICRIDGLALDYVRRLKYAANLFLKRFLIALERAAYRAHVARRVRPPARRARIPRPIYARPRPPTAPTAPPASL